LLYYLSSPAGAAQDDNCVPHDDNCVPHHDDDDDDDDGQEKSIITERRISFHYIVGTIKSIDPLSYCEDME